ncbi:hypothetical protein TWF718_007805 [Orbilia javanica]|uniref:Uncharacterized protein n=1 Tax=Orbilia javanica TaxID=47235 RepID=A0AAN8RMJ0_9PEZI
MSQYRIPAKRPRSARSRSPSPDLYARESDDCVESEYVSKYTDTEKGVTHYIYSFDDNQSIVPSSSSSEVDHQEKEAGGKRPENKNENKPGRKQNNSSNHCEAAEIKNETDSSLEERGRSIWASMTGRSKSPAGTEHTLERKPRRKVRKCFCSRQERMGEPIQNFNGMLILFVTCIIAGWTVSTVEMLSKQAAKPAQELAPIVNPSERVVQVVSETNESERTYFGLCGRNMDPCCFDTDNLVDQIREQGIGSIAGGFSNALGCWKHLRSSKRKT